MTSIINFFYEPLTYNFMVRALVAAIMVSCVCSFAGTYVVLKGMAFFGDALAHAILPGIAIGYLVNNGGREPIFWWALITAIISSFGISAISRSTKIKEDTAIGIIFAGMFALGIVIISTVKNYTVDLTHFLFGNVLGVSNSDLLRTAVFGGSIILIVILFYKEFLVLSFDPILATTLRLPAKLLDSLLLIIIAAAIVVSLQTVGVALMVAMLVTPAATAHLISRRLPTMMAIAVIISVVSSFIGLYLSYYYSVASGAAIVLTCTAIFFLIWMLQAFTGYTKKLKSNDQS